MSKVIVVGIGGITNGGKSTLCCLLSEHLTSRGIRASVLHMDDYFHHDDYPLHISLPEYNNEFIYWDRPEAVDFEGLASGLMQLIKNVNSTAKVCKSGLESGLETEVHFCSNDDINTREGLCTNIDFKTPAMPEDVNIHVIFVDGIMIYDSDILQNFFSLRYFLHLEFPEAKRRRALRTYPGGEPESYFEQYAWPCYLRSLNNLSIYRTATVSCNSDISSIASCDDSVKLLCEYNNLTNSRASFPELPDLNSTAKCENSKKRDGNFNEELNKHSVKLLKQSDEIVVMLDGNTLQESNAQTVLSGIFSLLNLSVENVEQNLYKYVLK